MTPRRPAVLAALCVLLALPGLSRLAVAEGEPGDDASDEETADAPGDDESADGDEAARASDATASDSAEPDQAPLIDRRSSSGLGFELSVGGLATFRRMTFSGSDHTIDHEPGIYLGGALRGAQHLWTFDPTSHLLVEAEAGFGSAKNAEVEPALGRPLTTEQTYVQLLGVFEKPVTSTFDVRLGLGLGVLSFTVEPNPRYTGHRYLTLVSRFGAVKWLDGPFRLGGAVTIFPAIDTNQSARDYGAARGFGARGEAFGTMRFYQPADGDLFGTAEGTIRYSFTRFRTSMPETQAVGVRAGTDDVQHTLVLMLSYYL